MRRTLLLLLVPLVAACSTRLGPVRDTGLPPGVGDLPGIGAGTARRPVSPADDPVAALPASAHVARYRGPLARAAAVLEFQRDADAIVDGAVTRLRVETGLSFADGRTPRVLISDAPDTSAAGDVALRVVEGLRRPEIRVPAGALALGEFRPKEHLPALVGEAGVLAASPERAPPEWVLRGLPPVFARTVDRRAAELVFAGSRVREGADALEPLEPAFRVLALQRIGLGERVLARFLEARLAGAGDGAALRDVGVGSMDFLDAAAATESARTIERALEDGRVSAVAWARTSLAAGDPDAAHAALTGAPDSDATTPWGDAEVALVRAEIALVRGDATSAVRALDDILSRPDQVLRLRDARFARALAALGTDDPAARERAVEFARAWPLDARTPPIVSDHGLTMQDALELGSGDAAIRARTALRIGQSGRAQAAPFLASALRDGDASVRRAAAAALGRLAAKDAAADVEAACLDPDAGVRMAALTALIQMDGARGLRRAKQLEGDPDPDVRAAALTIVAAAEPKAKPAPFVGKPGAAGPAGKPGTGAPAGLPGIGGKPQTAPGGSPTPALPGPAAPRDPGSASPPSAPGSVPARGGTVSVEPPPSPGTSPRPVAPPGPGARSGPGASPGPGGVKTTQPPRPPMVVPGSSPPPPQGSPGVPPKPLQPLAPPPMPGAQPPKRPEPPPKVPVPPGSPRQPPAPLPPPVPPSEPPKK